jgi:hypothetical protein
VVGIGTPDPLANEPAHVFFQEFEITSDETIVLPRGFPHYFMNTGSGRLKLLLEFEETLPDIVTFADLINVLPPHIFEAAMHSAPDAGKSLIIPSS